MNREELKEKMCKISNSEFPLIDFFNDIDWLDDRHFNTEKAYEDIEKIYDVFMFYINKCNKLEKELKQTKLNFKNSQTHSKNCYKKLKEKFERGKEVYHRNYELIQENGKLKQENQKLSIENHNSKIVEEMNKTVVENKNKQLLEATELNITYLDKIIMLKKTIEILKEYIMYEELDEILEKYPDLKEVLINEK